MPDTMIPANPALLGGGIGLRPFSGLDEQQATQIRLDEARHLARIGCSEKARLLCVETIIMRQPLIARDPALLRSAITTLIHAQAFRQVARLVLAVSGRVIRIKTDNQTRSVILARREDQDSVLYTVNPEALLADEAMIQRWSEELAFGETLQGAVA